MISLNESKKKLQLGVLGAVIIGLLVLMIPILFLKSSKKVGAPTLTVEKMIPPQSQTEKIPQDIKTIKQTIIDAKIKEDNGDYIIFESVDFKIIYLPSREIFFVTILRERVAKNKQNAEDWFKKFGLKQEDLCNLPVRFMVDFNLKKNNLNFNPLPSGCS